MSGFKIVPHVQGLGKRLEFVESPFEEGAHGGWLACQRVIDLGAQAIFGGGVFVGARAGDVLTVISEAAGKCRVGVDAEKQQMFERQVGDVQVERMSAFIGAHFHASHRQVDTRHQVLLFDLLSHLIGRRRFPCSEQASSVERSELVARRGDDPLNGFGKTSRASRCVQLLFPKRTPRRTRS